MRLNTSSLKKRLGTKAETDSSSSTDSPLLPRMLLAWLAGASFVFALAPYYIWVIALISPAILYALLLNPMSNIRAFILGEMYGMGLWCVGAFWLFTSIHTYGNTPVPLAVAMIAFMGLVMGLFHGFMALIFNRLGKQPASFTALWVLQEWLKTWLFTGFPWLFTGYAFTDLPFITSVAPIFGVFAISFMAIWLASALVEVLRHRPRFMLPAVVILFASMLLWLMPIAWTQPKGDKNLSVSLVQGNIPQDVKWLETYQQKTLQIYADLAATEWGRDLVVLPEAAIPLLQTNAWDFLTQIGSVAKQTHTALFTGIPYEDIAAYDPKTAAYPPLYNSVMALGDTPNTVYKKQNLVPGGEYMPFAGAINKVLPDLMGGARFFQAGSDNQPPLTVKNHNVGMAICYEVAYPDTTRKNALNSDFLLSVSNEAWFGSSPELAQHQQMAQMRSIETGRWFLRTTNTGLTSIINEHGKIVASVPPLTRTVLRGEVQSRTGTTPFMRWGSYPVVGLCGLLLVFSWLGAKVARPKRLK